MTGNQLRQAYLDFFQKRGHKIVPSSPIVPENDPSTLFTSAGMQPMMPYLLGQSHSLGTRIVDSQKCFRSQDIDEVGDNRHTTFFEMLGNWSLGDYFKKEQLSWLFEFLIKELGLPKEKLAVSVFEGNKEIPRDEETAKLWQELGIPKERIFYYGVDKNWWSRSGVPQNMPAGEPGGPDSEVFFEFTKITHNPKFGSECHPNCDCGRFLEIGNSVFMKYQKQADGFFADLPKNNIDFGGGLERLLAAKNDNPDVFETDFFAKAKATIAAEFVGESKNMRIILDHLRSATFIVDAGVLPANKAAGYVLRRLIRRAAVHAKLNNVSLAKEISSMIGAYVEVYQQQYPSLLKNREHIIDTILAELGKFENTLNRGMKEVERISPFDLYQTYGFPPEIVEEVYRERELQFDRKKFDQAMKQHQMLSRTASKGMFKGGLADNSVTVTKYHTATHLLHAALRQVLGKHVQQMGSNITGQRLRFDFTHPQALANEEIKQLETLVNEQIKAGLEVNFEEITLAEAKKKGALAFFGERYAESVKVYSIGSFSKEVCGGPPVANTSVIGPIEIYKQESVGAGRRRLYARLAS